MCSGQVYDGAPVINNSERKISAQGLPDDLDQIAFGIHRFTLSAPTDHVWQNETKLVTHKGQNPAT